MSEENMLMQTVTNKQTKLILSLQQLNSRKVIKKVERHCLTYSVGKTPLKIPRSTIPRIVITPPPTSRGRIFQPEDFTEILARIPESLIYSPATPTEAATPAVTSQAVTAAPVRKWESIFCRSQPRQPSRLVSAPFRLPPPGHRSQVKHVHHHHYHAVAEPDVEEDMADLAAVQAEEDAAREEAQYYEDLAAAMDYEADQVGDGPDLDDGSFDLPAIGSMDQPDVVPQDHPLDCSQDPPLDSSQDQPLDSSYEEALPEAQEAEEQAEGIIDTSYEEALAEAEDAEEQAEGMGDYTEDEDSDDHDPGDSEQDSDDQSPGDYPGDSTLEEWSEEEG